MAVHDRRYKRILTSPVFAYDVARLLADEFNLGTVARPSLRAGPTSSVRESERERIADAAWTFDTERQRTVMMIVEAQSSRQRHLAVRLLRYVVDRLLELCEDRERYDPAGGLPPVAEALAVGPVQPLGAGAHAVRVPAAVLRHPPHGPSGGPGPAAAAPGLRHRAGRGPGRDRAGGGGRPGSGGRGGVRAHDAVPVG
ncbi:MAG: hypothetical protein F4Y37_11665 [Caldilineaceae bacterium SB0664_bin_22]|nr:hypothetical protein [Caldilineaceae bacterium SB0664_bin_22]